VMVLLGGVQTLAGPLVGASVFTWLHDTIARETEYWRALLGATMLLLVILFPAGIVGSLRKRFVRETEPAEAEPAAGASGQSGASASSPWQSPSLKEPA
ncbi:hypothetical protein O6382_23985, partial [Salmonella enterica subsp. enterica]